MDESEFQRLLQLFPVVRSPNYCAEPGSASYRQIASAPAQDELKKWHDAWDERDKDSENRRMKLIDIFWIKLEREIAGKVGEERAERFCEAFQQIHEKLVYQYSSSDAARSLLNSS